MRKMRKMKERIVSFALTFVMVMSLLVGMAPVEVRAEEGEPAAQAETATLTYEVVGGSGTMESKQLTVGKEFILPAPSFTSDDGREFYGWFVYDSAGDRKLEVCGYEAPKFTPKGEYTYTAIACYGYPVTVKNLPEGTNITYMSTSISNPSALVIPEAGERISEEANCFIIQNSSMTSAPIFTGENGKAELVKSNDGTYIYVVRDITGPVTLVASSNPPAGETIISSLDVNLDWSKVPQLVAGMDKETIPTIANNIATVTGTGVKADLFCEWAVKVNESFKVNSNDQSFRDYLLSQGCPEGYIETFAKNINTSIDVAIANNDGWMPISDEFLDTGYKLNSSHEYAVYVKVTADTGYTFSLTANEVTSNVDFVGFYTNSDKAVIVYKLGAIVEGGGNENPPSATTTLTYEVVGGTGTMESKQLTVGEEFVLPDPSFRPADGREFFGWFVYDSAGDGDLEVFGYEAAKFTPKGDHTYTAYACYGYPVTVDVEKLPEGTEITYISQMMNVPSALVIPEAGKVISEEVNCFIIQNSSLTSAPSITGTNGTAELVDSDDGEYIYVVRDITGPVTITLVAHIHKVAETISAVPATCTTDGNNAYYKCDCGKYFKEENCTTETTVEAEKIPAGHKDTNGDGACDGCGYKENPSDHSDHTGWSAFSAYNNTPAINANGKYYLTSDLTDVTLQVNAANVTLCLNGHTISGRTSGGEYNTIKVKKGSSITICDCQKTGCVKSTASPSSTYVGVIYTEGNVSLYDVTIDASKAKLYGIYCNNYDQSVWETNVKLTNSEVSGYRAAVWYNSSKNQGGKLEADNCTFTNVYQNHSFLINAPNIFLTNCNLTTPACALQLGGDNVLLSDCKITGNNNGKNTDTKALVYVTGQNTNVKIEDCELKNLGEGPTARFNNMYGSIELGGIIKSIAADGSSAPMILYTYNNAQQQHKLIADNLAENQDPILINTSTDLTPTEVAPVYLFEVEDGKDYSSKFAWAGKVNDGEYAGFETEGTKMYVAVMDQPAVAPAITITKQPVPVTINIGEQATFTVEATGGTKYKWQVAGASGEFRDANGFGADTATYKTYETDKNFNGNRYRCIITDDKGNSVTSEEVTLTLLGTETPTQIEGVSIIKTANGYKVTGLGEAGDGYRWGYQAYKLREGENMEVAIERLLAEHLTYGPFPSEIANDFDESFVITTYERPGRDPESLDNYDYIQIMKLNERSYIYEVAILVLPEVMAPSISATPQNTSAQVGERATFSVTASGEDVTYQWQIDRNDGNGFVNLNGATGSSYTTSVVDMDCNGFKYQCIITNAGGSITTTPVVLIVTERPIVHTHSLTLVPAKAATCTAAGNTAYYTCSGCDVLFADADQNTTTTAEAVKIAKLAHVWTGEWTVTKEATATVEGKKETLCVNGCGQKKVVAIPATGVAEDEGAIEKDAEVAPDVAIDEATLDNKKEELLNAGSIFDETEKQLIENGADARVWLEITKTENSDMTSAEKAKMEEKAAEIMGDDVNITYFEADLFKQVGTTVTEIPEPGIAIKVTITIPEALLNTDAAVTRVYKILRWHDADNKLEVLDGTFNPETGEFSFETNKFSTYAIVYADTPVNEGNNASSSLIPYIASGLKDVVPKTGESNASAFFLALMVISGFGVVLCTPKKKRS